VNQTPQEQVSMALSDSTDGVDTYWPSLINATSVIGVAQSWLSVVCAEVPDIEAGILVLRNDQSDFVPMANWPVDTLAPKSLIELSELALESAKGTVRKSDTSTLVAYPIKLDSVVYGAVCLSINSFDMVAVRAAMRQLQ
jgi:hypothetical protein